MRITYNILFGVFLLLTGPFYFLKMWRRGNWRRGFGQRLGKHRASFKQALTNRDVIWIHAVSVGEVNTCTQLIEKLEHRMPNVKIVVSTTTSTGMGELSRKLPSHIEKIYYPLDLRYFVRRALNAIHPNAVVLVEAEIWPNLIWACQDRGIPMILVNARLSRRSLRGYRRLGFLFRPIFASFEGIGCQNSQDADHLRQLGARPEAVHILGSLKYDAAALDERHVLDVPALLRQIGVPAAARILVAGSTHAGEEEILAAVYRRLKSQFPDLFLIVVPRHFERGRDAQRALSLGGARTFLRTNIRETTQLAAGEVDCLLVDTTGELRHFYRHATVIFVGKSLAAHGGQNPIEPGALGKAMVFGPNMENFEAIAAAFVAQRGAVQVRDAAELECALARLLGDPDELRLLGENARQVVLANQGALERTTRLVADCVGGAPAT